MINSTLLHRPSLIFPLPLESVLHILSFIPCSSPRDYLQLRLVSLSWKQLNHVPQFWELIAAKLSLPLEKNKEFQQLKESEKSILLSAQIKDFWMFNGSIERLALKTDSFHSRVLFWTAMKDLVVHQEGEKIEECAHLFSFFHKPFTDESLGKLVNFYFIHLTRDDDGQPLHVFLKTFWRLFQITPRSQYSQIMKTYRAHIQCSRNGGMLDPFELFVGLKFSPRKFREWCFNRTLVIPHSVSIQISNVPDQLTYSVNGAQGFTHFTQVVGLTVDTFFSSSSYILNEGKKTIDFTFLEDTTLTHQSKIASQ